MATKQQIEALKQIIKGHEQLNKQLIEINSDLSKKLGDLINLVKSLDKKQYKL